jgi:hypothetical protein
MNRKPYLWLLGSILAAFSGWAAGATEWADLIAVGMLPVFIGQLASILLAWLGPTPVKPKGDK